jgi:hypothetical protein
MYRQRVTMGFGQRLTPFVRNILVGLVVLYVVQIMLDNWVGLGVTNLVSLWPPAGPVGSTGMFRPWQPVTALLFNGHPQAALVDWLMTFFFLGTTLDFLGRKGTAKMLGTVWVVGVLVGMALALPGIVHPNSPCVGVTALVSAMVIAYGMGRPDDQILVMFVLPMKGRHFVVLDIAIATLFFLYLRSFETAVVLAASLAAIVWMWCDGSLRVLLLKLRLRWLVRQRSTGRGKRGKFEVIDGGRGQAGNDDWVH